MFTKQPEAPLAAWLQELVGFVSDTHSIREIYCHPIGVPYYAGAMQALLDAARAAAADGLFGWHTMTEVAHFMTRRELVRWQADLRAGRLWLEASHPASLAHMAWRLPVARCARPAVVRGTASVNREGAAWRVVATGGTTLEVTCEQSGSAGMQAPQ